MMSTRSFIEQLLKQKEDINIEFMSEFILNNVLKVVCSFLNTDGGWILIGYSKNKVVGISSNIEDNIKELEQSVLDKISPQPLVNISAELHEKKNLILVNVLKGSRQPYSLERRYYIRDRGAAKQADPDDISLLLRTSNAYVSTWEKMNVIDAKFDNLQNEEIEETINEAKKIGRGKKLPDTAKDFLGYFKLQDLNLIKNGAIVLFGNDPVKFLPQCRIRITVMPYGKTGDKYSDILSIEESLFKSFTRVNDYFTKNLPLISEFKHDNWTRIVREKYPMEAIDEAVVNAMVHRDYADISGEITINIYQDCIEIINSGEIPSDIISDKNIIKPHHSIFRNPTIAHMFYLRGKMEKIGGGLILIKERFDEFGLKTPEWTTQNGYTTLTLYGTPKIIETNERMINYLNKLKPSEQFTREEYENFFLGGISEKTARNDISKLTGGGWVDKIGDGPTTKYVRTNKKLPDIT